MEYLFTERVHLMCPHMCFGLVIEVNQSYNEELIRTGFMKLSKAHPFLNALLGYEEENNAYYYNVTDHSKVQITFSEIELESLDSRYIIDSFRELTEYDWNLFEEGMLKVKAWKMQESTCLLMVFHHLLADGRAALGLVQELASFLNVGTEPEYAYEKLISSTEDFPNESGLSFVNSYSVRRANKKAEKEGELLSYENYHHFANMYLKNDKVRYSQVSLSSLDLSHIIQQCHEFDVTVNDYLLAKMMLEENTHRIAVSCDLRNRLSCYNRGALGNYSTVFFIETDEYGDGLFDLAKKIHACVKEKMDRPCDLFMVLQYQAALRPEVLDKAFISCKGEYESEVGKLVGSTFFGYDKADSYCISNLGKIDSNCIISGFFIPPASPAMKKTKGVLTINGEMRICTVER